MLWNLTLFLCALLWRTWIFWTIIMLRLSFNWLSVSSLCLQYWFQTYSTTNVKHWEQWTNGDYLTSSENMSLIISRHSDIYTFPVLKISISNMDLWEIYLFPHQERTFNTGKLSYCYKIRIPYKWIVANSKGLILQVTPPLFSRHWADDTSNRLWIEKEWYQL